MIPILLTAAAILTSLIIGTSSIYNGAKSTKTAEITVENDMLSTEVYQVINSEGACTSVIQNGDHGSPIPYVVPSGGAAPVYAFNQGLYFGSGGTSPFLTYSNSINSLTIPSPTASTAPLRLDPTGFINYGPQPTSSPVGSNKFSGLFCYLVNLHVESQSPQQTFGNRSHQFDFPMYIGVDASNNIQACQGAGVGSPCISANPIVVPSPNPMCAVAGGPATLGWTQTNTSYVIIQGVSPVVWGPQNFANSPAVITLPNPAPPSGMYTFTLTPYSNAGTAGSPVYMNVSVETPPGAPTASIDTSALMTWSTTDTINTSYISIAPMPGPTQAISGTYPITPVPAPSSVYTFTPYNSCNNPGTQTFATYIPSPQNAGCGVASGSCTSGTLAAPPVDNGTTTTWTCNGAFGGTNASCTLNDPQNGACGAAAGTCTTGTASAVTDDGTNKHWSCSGLNGGATTPCLLADPIPPASPSPNPSTNPDCALHGNTGFECSTKAWILGTAGVGCHNTLGPFVTSWSPVIIPPIVLTDPCTGGNLTQMETCVSCGVTPSPSPSPPLTLAGCVPGGHIFPGTLIPPCPTAFAVCLPHYPDGNPADYAPTTCCAKPQPPACSGIELCLPIDSASTCPAGYF